MEAALAVAAGALLVVAGCAVVGPRLRVPAPLLLVLVGVAVSLIPGGPVLDVPPEAVLLGVLPPLLYAASVSLPAMDLRREFSAVSGLSVLLVLVTALVLGWVFTLVIPGLAYGWGVALAAVISPTDAVATNIVKGTRAPHRVTAILEGESLLNDATALALLRAAVAAAGAAGAGFSLPVAVGTFAYSVVLAVVVGLLVGNLSVLVRARVGEPVAGTAISFAVPFAAALPVEALGGSGLVAAVVAGLAVGRAAPRRLSPQARNSDSQNWRTISLLLEGAIFLLMGLQIRQTVEAAGGSAAGRAVLVGLLAVGVTLVVRALFIGPLLAWLQVRSRHGSALKDRLVEMQHALESGDTSDVPRLRRSRPVRAIDVDRFRRRVQQVLADIDYLGASPLGWREGAVVVWAGMRGAVTVAAVQTLDPTTPDRALLVLIAFAAAAISLLLQGGSLDLVIRLLKPKADDPAALEADHADVLQLLRSTADQVPEQDGESRLAHRLEQLHAQRNALLDARDLGLYDSQVLGNALQSVDAAEVATTAMGDPGKPDPPAAPSS